MLFPFKGPDTCSKRGNLNYDRIVFKGSFDVDLMRTLKVDSIQEVRFYLGIWEGFSRHCLFL